MKKKYLLYKDKLEKEKYLKFIKKTLCVILLILFLDFIFSNNVYLLYKMNQDNYKLCEGRIEKIIRGGNSDYLLSLSYNLDGNMYEGTTIAYNLGDHEGDIITIIVKDKKIGRNQLVIGWVALGGLILFIGFLIVYYIVLMRLVD